jgi:hypothetical protein
MEEAINIILAADMEDRLNEFCKKCICHMFQKFNDCIIWKNLRTGDGSFRGRCRYGEDCIDEKQHGKYRKKAG